MKQKILFAFCIFFFLWAMVSTTLYLRLRLNPQVLPSISQKEELTENEKVVFLRQFIEKYFTYSSDNFWQSQTALAGVLASPLKEQRIQEVHRLQEKIKQKNFSQQGTLLRLQEGPQAYLADIRLRIQDQKLGAAAEILYIRLHLSIKSTDRTVENPWGLEIVTLLPQASTTPVQLTSHLNLKPAHPTWLSFPCALEKIESSLPALRFKITTLHTSEVQLQSQEDLGAGTIKAYCKDLEYLIHLETTANSDSIMFLDVPADWGKAREDKKAKARSKDIYDRTIEKVLGIELEN